MFINKTTGERVRLTAQTAESMVECSPIDNADLTLTLPSHEFFAQYREASRDEIDAAMAEPKAKATVTK